MPQSPSTSRDSSIDIAKGLAIVAIVFGHVWLGLEAAGLIRDRHTFEVVYDTVYMSHLSVFAFTAGLFVQRGMRRVGPWNYTLDRDLTFLWLYLLWTAIQGGVKLAAASVVNSPTSLESVLKIWTPDAQLWFFGWIALMMVFTALFRPWGSKARMAGALLVAGAASLAMWGLGGSVIGTQGLALTIFFVVATIWRGDRFLTYLASCSKLMLIAAGGLGLGVMVTLGISGLATPPTLDGESRTVVSVALGVVASTAGVVGVLAVSRVIARVPWVAWLSKLGEKSMVIFVAHIVFTSGTRIVLNAAGVDNLTLQAVVGTAVGILGPLTLGTLAPRFRIAWLFELPTGWTPARFTSRRIRSS